MKELLSEYNSYFIISSHCQITGGANRTLITDFQRTKMFYISNSYKDLLLRMDRQLIEDVLSDIDPESMAHFYDFIQFLLAEEIGFLTKDLSLFPEKSREWHSTSKISNAIMDFKDIFYDYKRAVKDLQDLKCKALQLRFYSEIVPEKLEDILDHIGLTAINYVEIYCPFSAHIDHDYYNGLLHNYAALSNIVIYNSPESTVKELIFQDEDYHPLSFGFINYITDPIKSEKGCGLIGLNNMNFSSWSAFNEMQKFNGCLNKKISIDKNGLIKNCPSLAADYGHINDTSLRTVVENPDFIKLFTITKDRIAVCKDCEYRSNCTDCRAYLEEPANIYSKPLKCGYNPYTNEWEDWSDNSLKSSAIKYYEFDEI